MVVVGRRGAVTIVIPGWAVTCVDGEVDGVVVELAMIVLVVVVVVVVVDGVVVDVVAGATVVDVAPGGLVVVVAGTVEVAVTGTVVVVVSGTVTMVVDAGRAWPGTAGASAASATAGSAKETTPTVSVTTRLAKDCRAVTPVRQGAVSAADSCGSSCLARCHRPRPPGVSINDHCRFSN